MARGFFAGLIVGTIAVAGSVAVLSVVLDGPEVATTGQAPDPGSPPGLSAEGGLRGAGGDDAPSSDTLPDAVEAPDARSVARPADASAGAAREALGDPAPGIPQEDPAGGEPADAAPVVGPEPAPPEAPAAADGLQPGTPDARPEDAAPERGAASELAALRADDAPDTPADPQAPEAPDDGAPEQAGPDAAMPNRDTAVVPEADRPAPDTSAQDPGPPAPGTSAATQETGEEEPDRRLPQVVTEPAAAPEASPLSEFAVPVDAAPDLPRMAVVLIDDGMGPLGPDALAAFPFPVSFAIDPAHPDPSGAARGYRDLGFEVLALARLPEGAAPQDVETTLRAALDAVPGAVAVLEAPEGGMQASRDVAAQAASVLAETGHGLVAVPEGLNTGQQLAARAGVPSVTLFRDFDSAGQDARVIRRFLDQAAFRAGQEDGVVMLGRVRADTISALVLWGLQDRAQSVALVPISVVLREADDASGG